MAFFYLVRHGQTDWNVSRRVMGRQETPLNSVGERQVEELGRFFEKLRLNGVYCSPQKRAVQTAQAIAKNNRSSVERVPQLAEVDFKAWEKKEWAELQALESYQAYRRNPLEEHQNDFEPIPKVRDRTWGLVEELEKKNPEGRYVLVSHADPLRTIICTALKMPLERFRSFPVLNATVSLINKRKDLDLWNLWLFNYRPDADIHQEMLREGKL